MDRRLSFSGFPLCPSPSRLRPRSSRAGQCGRNGRSAGFSLVEVMVVVMIISILAALGVPAIIRVKTKAKVSVIVSDLRTFSAAFDAHAQESGGWPAEVDAGVFPAGMTGRLNEVSWQRKTPIGGKYNWDYDQLHGGIRPRAAIAISNTDDAPLVEDADLWLEIDRAIDDGNLGTGNFRLGADSHPVFIVLP
jgi:prepilin-type N-terminal cleavage/methylation domain-containing protein